MAILEVKNLTYEYPGSIEPAVKDISFEAEVGDLIALVGANGAGKSTLCYALAGFIPHLFSGDMQGCVLVDGLDTRAHSLSQMAGRVGMVMQNPTNQLSGVRSSVYEEVAFGLENLGVPRGEMPLRIMKALRMVGIQDLAARSPYTLSGGEQQRLALASILIMEPGLLVLDEPTAMLDPEGTSAFFRVIQELRRMGTTVVLAENRLEWIGEYASQVIALARGEIIESGAPQVVLTSSRLIEYGIGWTRFTQAAGSGKERGLWPADRQLPLTLMAAVEGFREYGK